MKRYLALVSALITVAFALAASAQAHVTVHPNALPAGTFAVVNIVVPNEEAAASTVKVDVQFPNNVYTASPAAMPGWKGSVITKKLAKPVEIEKGFSVTTRVDRVVFSGGKIRPGQFLSFPVSLLVPKGSPGTKLTFKALQTYSNGKVVRWIGSPSADEPAPQVVLRSESSPVLDYPAGAAAASQGMTRTMKGVLIGVPLGALGAFVALRRRMRVSQ